MGCSTRPGQRINRCEGERSAVSDIDGKRAGSVVRKLANDMAGKYPRVMVVTEAEPGRLQRKHQIILPLALTGRIVPCPPNRSYLVAPGFAF